MKRFWLIAVLTIFGLGMAVQAQADTLLGVKWLTPSNPATEEAWLQGLIEVDGPVIYYGKDEDGIWNDGVWSERITTADWTYAVLKYGVGKPSESNPNHWAILDDNDKVVSFELDGLPTNGLSHITYFGTKPASETSFLSNFVPVPEPATMLLLGTGLAGLFGWRKKFRKA